MSDQSAIATSVNAAILAVQTAIAGVGTLRTATLVQLAPVTVAVALADALIDAAVLSLDADISNNGGVAGLVPGQPGPIVGAMLVAQASASDQLARLLTLRSYLKRITTNIAQATG